MSAQVRSIIEGAFEATTREGPTSYPRKLRRALLTAIQGNDVHAIVRELCSEASHMFCHARSRLEHTHASLDEAQHRGVVAFLAWIADEESFDVIDRYRAAAGLRWVWTAYGVDRAPLAKFFEARASYRRARFADEATEIVAATIEAAFANTPAPVQITTAECDEACDVALLFNEQKWASLHPDLMAIEPDAPGWFTPHAFRYYLPAYLLGALAGIVDAPDIRVERYDFSGGERSAIELFLETVDRAGRGAT